MIQRQQSLWLLLSAICAFFSFQFPFYNGTKMINNMVTAAELNGGSSFFLVVFTGASLILAVVAIFLFKDRKLQLRMCFLGIGVSIITLVFYFTEMKKFEPGGAFSLSCLFAFVVAIGFILAARAPRRDRFGERSVPFVGFVPSRPCHFDSPVRLSAAGANFVPNRIADAGARGQSQRHPIPQGR